MLYLFLGCTGLSILWALCWPMSRSLAFYLIAQGLYVLCVGVACGIFGDGRIYGIIYALFTAIALSGVMWLSWESLLNAKYKARVAAIALVLVIGLARKAGVSMAQPLDWYEVTMLIEGSCLFWGSLIVGFSVIRPVFPKWLDIYWGLSMLWLGQAVVDFGVLMHYPGWTRGADYISPLLGTVAFLYLGLRLRSHRLALLRNGVHS